MGLLQQQQQHPAAAAGSRPGVAPPPAGGGAGGINAVAAAAVAALAAGARPAPQYAPREVASLLTEPHAAITLDVGGRRFRTTLNTLLAVQDTLFVALLTGQAAQAGIALRLPSGELFIDRCGEQFGYILEYMRACAANDLTFPLPDNARCVRVRVRARHGGSSLSRR
jgi:hypothetical protein